MAPSLTVIEYLPSTPVEVPLLVPFSTTLTAGIGLPSSEVVTVPVTVLLCDQATVVTNAKRTMRHLRQQKYNFVMLLFVWVNIG